MSLRVLVLPRHSPRAASCRHRFVQFLPALRAHGIECDLVPFFDERYTDAVLGFGRKQWWRFGQAAWRRAGAVLGAREYDLVVVHAEFVPFLPFALERWLGRGAFPYLVDFDDAFFHAYDAHSSPLVRRLLGTKLGRLMEGAALNTPGSDYLAEYAQRFSTRVTLVPTVVDLEHYPDVRLAEPAGPFVIGWIGSPSTTPHLQSVMGEIAAFAQGRDVEVVAIGATRFDAPGVRVRFVPWRYETEVEELSRTHVGIMPLPDSPWTRGKCGFKLIQTMACWRPVVASPVGANRRIVEHDVNGLLAGPGEWAAALARLHADPALRQRLGEAGRRSVEHEYSTAVWGPRVASLWARAAGVVAHAGERAGGRG